jgi:antitoxin YefM
MCSINITNARKNMCRLVENRAETPAPVHITGRSRSAVLIGEDHWRSIEETLSLLLIPGMRDLIPTGTKDPLEKGFTHSRHR